MPYGQMFDAVDVSAIPRDAKQVAGYVDGQYRNWPELARRFPMADKLSITVTGTVLSADCIDVEQGTVSPSVAAVWAARKLHLLTRPRVYCSLSNWSNCIDAMGLVGIPPGKVWWWIAEWTGHAHEINGAACVQYASPDYGAHGHYDVSMVLNGHFVPSKRAA